MRGEKPMVSVVKGRIETYIKPFILLSIFLFTSVTHAEVCSFFLNKDLPKAHEVALEVIDFPEDGRFFIFERILRLALYEAFDGHDFYTGLPLQYEMMSID